MVVSKGTDYSNTMEFHRKIFPLYLKELEFQYNHRFDLIFEQLVAFMSDFVPELPDEADTSFSLTDQR